MDKQERKRKTIILTIITIIILIIILLLSLSCTEDGIFYEDLHDYLSRNDYKELDVEDDFLKDTNLYDENFICETISYENDMLEFYNCKIKEEGKTEYKDYCTYDGKDFICENKEEDEKEEESEDKDIIEQEVEETPSAETENNQESTSSNQTTTTTPPVTNNTQNPSVEEDETTVPEQPAIINFDYSKTGYTKEDVTITISSTNNLLYCTTSSSDCTPNTNLTSEIKFTTEGTHKVCVLDTVTNEIKCSETVTIDRTAPIINEPTITGTKGDNGWYKTHVLITENGAVDNLSGIKDVSTDKPFINYTTNGETVTITAIDNAGNTSTKELTFKVDNINPTISNYTINGTTGENNWYITDVNISGVGATDNLSGVASVTPNQTTFTTETVGTDFIITATDNAGNTTQVIEEIKIDKTAPVITDYDITEKDILNEWHKTIVVINNIQATDSISGINTSTISPTEYTIDYETLGEQIELRVKDLAGNTTTERFTVKVDLLPPISGTIGLNGSVGNNGWYNSDVSITTTEGSDSISGIKSSELNMHIVTGVQLETTVYLTTEDNAGHTSTTEQDVKIDKIVPEVGTIVPTGTKGDNGWYTSNVTIGKTDGVDSGSGHASTTVDILEINDNTVGTTVTITTEDQSGLEASYSEIIKIDKVVPTITQKQTIRIEKGATVDLTTKFDATFGVSTGTITCDITDTSTLNMGTHNLTCTAKSVAGLSSVVNTTIEVVQTYEVLEYIESDGDQFINTGLMNTGDYIFEDEFLITNIGLSVNDGSWIVGGRVSPSYSMGVFINKTSVISAYGTGTKNLIPAIKENIWYPMYFSRFKLTIGANNYIVPGQLLIPNMYEGEIVVGGNQVAYDGVSKDTRNMVGKRKYFKITDATTGKLLRHYIPVKLMGTNEIGMWDLVEDKFYGNDGTGEFTEPTP